jgi:hypothetical protein
LLQSWWLWLTRGRGSSVSRSMGLWSNCGLWRDPKPVPPWEFRRH